MFVPFEYKTVTTVEEATCAIYRPTVACTLSAGCTCVNIVIAVSSSVDVGISVSLCAAGVTFPSFRWCRFGMCIAPPCGEFCSFLNVNVKHREIDGIHLPVCTLLVSPPSCTHIETHSYPCTGLVWHMQQEVRLWSYNQKCPDCWSVVPLTT